MRRRRSLPRISSGSPNCARKSVNWRHRSPGSARSRPMNAAQAEIDAVLAQINRVILGKDPQIRLCLACLLARGHLLIEDIPGVGKTTLAHALAKTLGLSFQRVQFTSDLLPGRRARRVHLTTAKPASSDFSAGRFLRSWCWRMKSTAPRPRRRARCSKPWRSTKSPSTANRWRFPSPSSSSPRKIRRTRSAPSRCPSRNWIGS